MSEKPEEQISKALFACLFSPNEMDSNFENANIVDALFAIARALDRCAKAIENMKTVDSL